MGNKLQWILGITVIFFLILATNYIDKNNFRRIQESIENIYQDRLLAKDLVFEMALLLQDKRLAYSTADTSFYNLENSKVNIEINQLIETFSTTKLTKEEARVFNDLKAIYTRVVALEENIEQGLPADSETYQKVLINFEQTIYELAKIQVQEGRRQMFRGKQAMESIDLLTTIEIYFLVALAILLQIIVIYKPKS